MELSDYSISHYSDEGERNRDKTIVTLPIRTWCCLWLLKYHSIQCNNVVSKKFSMK